MFRHIYPWLGTASTIRVIILMIEAIFTSETSVHSKETTRRCAPEGPHLLTGVALHLKGFNFGLLSPGVPGALLCSTTRYVSIVIDTLHVGD
jgi:N-acetylglucosamine-6-phosphate deacetylase